MNVDVDGRLCRLPDFMIVGAPRCGTTALYQYLSSHPDIFMPAEKEPMFFTGYPGTLKSYIFGDTEELGWLVTGLAAYAELFSGAGEQQIAGEGSTWYLSHPETVIPAIRDTYGEYADQLKIIIMLRNPAERAWSHWNFKKGNGREPLPFREAIQPDLIKERLDDGFSPTYDYIGTSLYANHVSRWLDAFPRIRVFIYEEFFRDLEPSLKLLLDFLGRKPLPQMKAGKSVNVSGQPRNRMAACLLRLFLSDSSYKRVLKPIMPARFRKRLKIAATDLLIEKQSLDPILKQKLMNLYVDDISNLERVINRSLDIWREGPVAQGGRETGS